MANWFYFDEKGKKQGPVRGRDLKQLAKNGAITPETIVENEEGNTGKAGKVQGLEFPQRVTASAVQPKPQPSAKPVAQGNAGVYGFKQEPPKPIPVPPPVSKQQPVQQQAPAPQSVYCTYCGQPVNPTAVACLSCGASPKGHKKFCGSCGAPLSEVQVICVKCGVAVNVPPPQQANIWKTITGRAATQPPPNYLQQPYQSSNAGELPVPISPTATIKKLNTCYFWYWLLAVVTLFLGLVALVAVLGGLLLDDTGRILIVSGIISNLAGLIAIPASVFYFVLLYTLWTVIPPNIARTTPGKAVGFCFIPFFNFYWYFVAIWGCGQDINKALQQQGHTKKVVEGLGLTLCILTLLCLVPFINIVAGIAYYIIAIIYLKMLKNGATILLEQKLRNEPNIQY